MRTCSLACFQVHKVRTSCSGKRDLAKHIPKREMKSSTMDMDYNFLKDVERTRVEASSEVDKLRGVKRRDKKALHRESKIRRAMVKAK